MVIDTIAMTMIRRLIANSKCLGFEAPHTLIAGAGPLIRSHATQYMQGVISASITYPPLSDHCEHICVGLTLGL